MLNTAGNVGYRHGAAIQEGMVIGATANGPKSKVEMRDCKT
jgi:hypothetical protein